MPVRALVWRSFYQDSVVLMSVATELRALPGVREAAALMGTPANRELLAGAGLATPASKDAAGDDLIIAVDAGSDADADGALAAARALLEDRRRARESTGRGRPRTLDAALRQLPDANLATISVPGEYAKLEALTALRRGLHVFLFSDNVPLADEIELKRLAVEKRLLCMGPDCGTAYLNGTGLGFANVVPRGRVGCVAASGTGLQAVVSRLAALGEGVSHGIGVGGRDLSAEVGGLMTRFALEVLAADPSTEVILVISKPPAPDILPALEAAISAVGKPTIVCALGATGRPGAPGSVRSGGIDGLQTPARSGNSRFAGGAVASPLWVATLEDAAEAAMAMLHVRPWAPRVFTDSAAVRARLAALAPRGARGGGLLGLFTGGTLAHEARVILEPLLGPIATNVGGPSSGAHRILDLGADEFTRGRPHPMLDTATREARVREAGRSSDIGVVLFDVVLGRAAHPDPARALAEAFRAARAAAEREGRSLVAIASVIGTEGDPQGLRGQVARLESAAVEVLPSNAQAARFAALVLEPGLAPRLLDT